MSAPSPDLSSSVSSSGLSDGLGRRVIVFDREDGAVLESLHVRPEFGAFEATLRDRIERLVAFDDERFARIRGLDRDPDTGELVVISEFVPGTRLSDLLDGAQEAAQDGITPGLDVALGYLLEALPALSALHAAAGVPHGAISPARTVLTPAGQVVFLDAPFAQVLERLRFSRRRLWNEFGLAMPASSIGYCRFDVPVDIGQVALTAVMLVLGRPLQDYEFPTALPNLMSEVVDVAQIRGTPTFAGGIERFLQRALPLTERRPYLDADEAAVDVLQIAQQIGVPVCKRALLEFVWAAEELAALQAGFATTRTEAESLQPVSNDVDIDAFLAEVLGNAENLANESGTRNVDLGAAEIADEEPAEESLPADDNLSLETSSERSEHDGVESSDHHQEDLSDILATSAVEPVSAEPARAEPAATETFAIEPTLAALPATSEAARAEPGVFETMPAEHGRSEATPEEVASPEPAAEEPIVTGEPGAPEADASEAVGAESSTSSMPEPSLAESPRRKRLHAHSVRSRKDKLRSIAAAGHYGPTGATPRAAPAPLVSPDRAAAYEVGIDDYSPATRPIGFAPPPPSANPTPNAPAYAPAALAPPKTIPMPQFGAPPVPNPRTAPTTIWTAPPIALEPPAAAVKPAPTPSATPIGLVTHAAPTPSPIKLKTDAGTVRPVRIEQREPRVARLETDDYGPFRQLERAGASEPRSFPWKLAAAGLMVIAVGIGVGRWYLSSRPAPKTEQAAAAPVAAPSPAKPTVPMAPPPNAGHIAIQTEPPGAHVLLDGNEAGDTPIKLDVSPGRHVLTFVTASGSVKRNVRVDTGKLVTLDVPLFSGWVTVFSPVTLDVAENGKSIGSTEDGRLMLPPGAHELTLTNRELGYVRKETVQIEAGEVASVNVEARGSVNFNAIPWAEVWIDGKKIGDTPLANAQVPIGLREIVFKNPDFGERKMVTTVRGDSTAALSVDFTQK